MLNLQALCESNRIAMTSSTQNSSSRDDPTEAQNRKSVRVAFILRSGALQPWQRRLIEEVYKDKNLELCYILNAADPLEGQTGIASSLLHLLERIERKFFLPNHLTNSQAPDHVLSETTTLEISPKNLELADTLEKLSGLDVIVSLVPISNDFAMAIAAHSTLWTIAAGQSGDTSQTHFGFWEMFNREGISSLALLEISASGTAQLSQSIIQQQFCYARNKSFLLEKSSPLVLRELRRRASPDHQQSEVVEAGLGSEPASVSIGDVIGYVIRLAANLASKVYKAWLRKTGRRLNRWSLFVGSGSFDPDRMSQAAEVHPPADEFWADPFLFRIPGGKDVLVFFENYEFSTGRGKISVGRLDGNNVVYLGDALITPYHLSYPFVYEYDGDIYMIPETAQSRQVEIWKAVDFPLGWTLHKTVLQGSSCADTTLFEHDGSWWMFTNMSIDSFDDHCSELHVFKIDSPLLNEIEPHELNPVITDARTARNAGRIAVRDGKLTRLAQNNAHHYGYGFSLMEIENLSLKEYREKCVYSAEPGFAPGICSTHHLDELDGIHIFDGYRAFHS